MHVFPDGKKYVGCTSKPLRERWQGGLGYKGQRRMFGAILKYGWENINHYLLFDGLDKDVALTIEALLIRNWKTYTKGKGYNSVLPNIADDQEFEIPEFKRIKVKDDWDKPVRERLEAYAATGSKGTRPGCKPVRMIETGEVFKSGELAARSLGLPASRIYNAIRSGGAVGTYWLHDDEEGWTMEMPAHWEYVEKEEDNEE